MKWSRKIFYTFCETLAGLIAVLSFLFIFIVYASAFGGG